MFYVTFLQLFIALNFPCMSISGVILKMARLIKDGNFRGQKTVAEFVSKPPSKNFIIPSSELVQVIAKVVPDG